MASLNGLLVGSSVARTVLVVSVVAAVGVAIGRPRWRGLSLGVVGVLFSGLIFARAGIVAAAPLLDFLRDFGLILFVYSIGMQVGPGFLASLRRQGWMLNLGAAAVVGLGTLMAVAIHKVGGAPIGVAVGILAGATTNTPSLAAAQQLLGDLGEGGAATALSGVGYAVAYPLGVAGVISSMMLLQRMLRIGVTRAAAASPDGGVAPAVALPRRLEAPRGDDHPPLLGLFSGIALGALLGSVPLPLPGLPVPIKLGLAGGPLLVAMVLGRIRRVGPIVWDLSPGARVMLRDLGIVLFLACVGLKVLSRFGHVSFVAVCGFLAGSMTDPPALAFANGLAGSEGPAVSYAAVYPLVMVLRVIAAQVLVVLFS